MESGPVRAALEDGLQKLRLLAVIDAANLAEADGLAELLGQEVSAGLVAHREALDEAKSQVAELTALRVARLLRKEPRVFNALKLLSGPPPTPADAAATPTPTPKQSFDGLIAALHAAGEVVCKRLDTTLEEENGRKAQFESAVDRERKAAKELQTLERQLAGEHADRVAIVGNLNAAESRAMRDLKLARSSYDRESSNMAQNASDEQQASSDTFSARRAALEAEVTRLRAELDTSSKAHRDEESGLRKKRTKAEQEVANWVAEYDKDMGAREALLQEERGAAGEVAARLAAMVESVTTLKQARLLFDLMERERSLKEFSRKMKTKARERAARTIQTAWRAHRPPAKPKTADSAASGKKKK